MRKGSKVKQIFSTCFRTCSVVTAQRTGVDTKFETQDVFSALKTCCVGSTVQIFVVLSEEQKSVWLSVMLSRCRVGGEPP